jgi:hypothetical protein
MRAAGSSPPPPLTEGVFLGRRSPQTFAKLQREQAKREKRELKQEKKVAAAEAKRTIVPGSEQT